MNKMMRCFWVCFIGLVLVHTVCYYTHNEQWMCEWAHIGVMWLPLNDQPCLLYSLDGLIIQEADRQWQRPDGEWRRPDRDKMQYHWAKYTEVKSCEPMGKIGPHLEREEISPLLGKSKVMGWESGVGYGPSKYLPYTQNLTPMMREIEGVGSNEDTIWASKITTSM